MRARNAARVAVGVCAAAMTLAPVASADTALWIHGASIDEIPLIEVMRRIPPGYTLQEVDYPGQLWPWTGLGSVTGAQSIAAGVPALDAAIYAALAQDSGNVLVIGESLGSMVVDQELRNLALLPNPPDPSRLRFEVIADPTRPGGLVSYHRDGSVIALTGTTQQPVAETPYDVTVIKLQYDGVASWPDRPWNLLAVLNAIVGGVVYHGTDHYGFATQDVINGRVPPEFITTTTNARGGVTTTYTVQQKPALLHLLEPIFPHAVNAMDAVLTPLIDRGYWERSPWAGPHLGQGGVLVDSAGQPVLLNPNPSGPYRTRNRPATAAASADAGLRQPALPAATSPSDRPTVRPRPSAPVGDTAWAHNDRAGRGSHGRDPGRTLSSAPPR